MSRGQLDLLPAVLVSLFTEVPQKRSQEHVSPFEAKESHFHRGKKSADAKGHKTGHLDSVHCKYALRCK